MRCLQGLVNIYVCTFVCMYRYLFISIYLKRSSVVKRLCAEPVYINVYTCVYIITYQYSYIYVCVYVYIYIYICIHICSYIYMYSLYIYMYKYIFITYKIGIIPLLCTIVLSHTIALSP